MTNTKKRKTSNITKVQISTSKQRYKFGNSSQSKNIEEYLKCFIYSSLRKKANTKKRKTSNITEVQISTSKQRYKFGNCSQSKNIKEYFIYISLRKKHRILENVKKMVAKKV